MNARLVGVQALAVLLAGFQALAAPDFTRDIQPIFEARCVQCHGPEEQNGGLRYDQKARAFVQADSGHHAIVPGKPDQSELLKRVTSTHKNDQMPPKGARLSPRQIETLTAWIAAGAEWPETAQPVAENKPASTHWAFQPLTDPPLPEIKDKTWPLNPIDHFIQAKREAAGLTPAPDAEPHVLARRLSYALTGLPPDKFEFRISNFELSAALESLLSSPHYGERWARHWLDWVRYADTAGDNSDYPIPQARLYRDYVIQSLNDDLPYDRFLTEQLAGDLLPAASQEEKNRQTIATGYIALSRRFGSLIERYPWHVTIEDTLDNLGRTVMGLTLSCARCHDHKFDPVTMRDYYGLYGIFASTRYPQPGLELFKAQHHFPPLIPEKEAAAKLAPFEKETRRLEADLTQRLAADEAKAIEFARLEKTASLDEQRRLKGELDRQLRRTRDAGEDLAKHLKKLPLIPAAYAVSEAAPSNARLQMRGEPERPGAEVPRKFPDILGGHALPADIAAKTSGRLQLAQWITDPKNPLTARVIVNRVWQRHFGKGLVPTTSDFGLRGEPPTHPDLLDWLATDFIRHGWSLKHLHRRILTSRTWRMASTDSADNLASDPGNTLYWKFNRQRLDAESLRDTLLLLSGQLDLTPQDKPFPFPAMKDWGYTQHHPFKDDYPSNKRSIYQMTKRLTAAPYMQTFDGPDPNACTATRDSSVTALQALHFLNDETVHTTAEGIVKALLKTPRSNEDHLTRLHRQLFARAPSTEEQTLLLTHLKTLKKQTPDPAKAWASLTRSLLRANEFLYLD
ncbi:MAG TPA: PSD1 and planctomycete cytochrome C domain-containing protein [Prosthecobacter sp.]|nr:PSD1 and planctomycete cytochrome C domain-containing protein [Prosthecobacter sp.]